MILLFFIQSLWADPFFCQKNLVAQDFLKIESTIETKISQAANLVTIAGEADKVLAQLLTTKNPVLIAWLEERKLMEAKEEVIASHWRRYYLQKFILSKFPTPHPKVNRSVESFFFQINKVAFTSPFKEKISILFKKAQSEAIKQVDSWTVDKKVKKEIIHRLEGVRLYWFEKLRRTIFQNKPLEFLNKSLTYNFRLNQINVGVPLLGYPNDESLFTIFLQTMAQTLSPDQWSVFFKTPNPFVSLQSCLEKNMGTSDKDQIQEAFTHWFSAEVLAKSPYLNSGLRMNICHKSSQNQDHLEKIYGVQPQIKKELDLKNPGQHCPF